MTDFQFALILVLLAAFLHALWNALIKGSSDRLVSMGLINAGHGILGIVMVLIFPVPAVEAWPFIAASTFIHFFYYGFLIYAYKYGDLSQVYPIARGVAPVLVSLFAFVFMGETLSGSAWLGVLAVSAGIFILFLSRGDASANPRAILFALLTGLTIACYSVVDGAGVRVSEFPLGYIGWLFLFEFLFGIAAFTIRRRVLREVRRRTVLTGLLGGVISAVAYGLAIYAKTLTELGTVSAIRESSVVIAALIGVVWFRERPWRPRLFSAAVVAAGVTSIAVYGH